MRRGRRVLLHRRGRRVHRLRHLLRPDPGRPRERHRAGRAPGGREGQSGQLDHPRQDGARHGRGHGPVRRGQEGYRHHGAHPEGRAQDPEGVHPAPDHPDLRYQDHHRDVRHRRDRRGPGAGGDQPRVHRGAGAGRHRGHPDCQGRAQEHDRLSIFPIKQILPEGEVTSGGYLSLPVWIKSGRIRLQACDIPCFVRIRDVCGGADYVLEIADTSR